MADNGLCSLIEAINNANDLVDGQGNQPGHDDCAAGNPAGVDTIILPAAGSFSLTQIEDTDVEVPAGRFRAKLYTVVHGDTVKRLWFATELPGPPVSYTTVKNGKEVLRMTMLRAR